MKLKMAIDGAPELINELMLCKTKFYITTNNSSKTPEQHSVK